MHVQIKTTMYSRATFYLYFIELMTRSKKSAAMYYSETTAFEKANTGKVYSLIDDLN